LKIYWAKLFKSIKEDIDTALRLDPSARNHLEVFLTYPGIHAVWGYRIAHFLWKVKLKLLARIYSNWIELLPVLRFIQGRKLAEGFY